MSNGDRQQRFANGVSLLLELPPELRRRIASETIQRTLTPGEILVLEGERCPGLCVVESGLIKVFKTSADGREQVLLLACPGDSFADAAAFIGDVMPASVAAVDASTVQILPAAALDRLIREDWRFSRAVIHHLSRTLQHVVSLVEDLSFRHVQARVAKVLLQALRPQGGVGAGLGRRPLTQREIAEMVGTAREVVSRTLSSLEERHLIRVDHGQIELLDAEGLESLL